jgi:hypothetical protein
MRCEPAATIIERLGGTRAVSEVAKVDQSRVIRWRLPKENGGTGGVIPSRHVRPLLDHAKANGLALTADDFFATAGEAA